MKEDRPSKTALQVAMRRAAHQVLDDPRIFDDNLSLRILGIEDPAILLSNPKLTEETPLSLGLRASLAARSRYAEDELHLAVNRGIQQYVILGAGLDTFAYRNPYPEGVLDVFEVDYPSTQSWKRMLLEESDIPIPETLIFAPIDFETQTLDSGLLTAGLDKNKSTYFSWLGVTPYLTGSAVNDTLRFVVSMPVGSGIVFDYMILPTLLNPNARRAFDKLSNHVASSGEPFQSFFDPPSLKSRLLAMGFQKIEDKKPEEINARYFQGRNDKFRFGSLSHIMNARI